MANGLSVFQIFEMFPDEATAEAWFCEQRWPGGVRCVECHSDNVQARPTRKPQPFRCRDCRKDFSAKTGSVMHASKLPIRTWVLAMWLLSDRCKGTSSHQLARDLGVTQKTAWFLSHRIREAWRETYSTDRFTGPVEVDEMFVGGKAKGRHRSRQADPTLDLVTAVAGIVDHDSGKAAAVPVADLKAPTLIGFIKDRTVPGAVVRTDEGAGYKPLAYGAYRHQTVNHSSGEYVGRDGATTNSIESLWALFKRGYVGTYHHMSRKHLARYLTEFTARHNMRHVTPTARLSGLAAGADGKRLDWATLTAA